MALRTGTPGAGTVAGFTSVCATDVLALALLARELLALLVLPGAALTLAFEVLTAGEFDEGVAEAIVELLKVFAY